jgi:cyclic lactone autoinducer peptide
MYYIIREELLMKNKAFNLLVKFGGAVSALALTLVTVTSNSTCVWYTYQEEMPDQAKKLRKF